MKSDKIRLGEALLARNAHFIVYDDMIIVNPGDSDCVRVGFDRTSGMLPAYGAESRSKFESLLNPVNQNLSVHRIK